MLLCHDIHIYGFIRFQIEVGVAGFTIVAMHKFDDDSDRNWMKTIRYTFVHTMTSMIIFFLKTIQ